MIKKAFENLSLVQKIQLYLLLPMFFWLLLFSIETLLVSPNKGVNFQQKNRVTIDKNKIEKSISAKVINFLEEKIELYSLSLKTINIKTKNISLEVTGGLENSLSFVQKIQIHLKIVSYKLIKNEKDIHLTLHLNSEYFFNKELIDKEFVVASKRSKKHFINLKIDAIVNGEVLLDNLWYKEGEIYKNKYQIIQITQQYIKIKHISTQDSFKVNLSDESL